IPARLAALSMATWKRGWRTTLLERRASLATTWAGMSRHQMIESMGAMSGGSCYGVLDGRGEIAETGETALEREAQTSRGRLGPRREVRVVRLGEVDEPAVVPEVVGQQLRVAVEAEPGPDDRVELACQEVGQVERPDFLLLEGPVGCRTGIELVAVGALDPVDALAFEIGVEGSRRPAIGVGDEDADVTTLACADLLDLGRHGVGDQLRAHVETGIDRFDANAGDPAGQCQHLARQGSAADDDESRRGEVGLCVRPHWRGAR